MGSLLGFLFCLLVYLFLPGMTYSLAGGTYWSSGLGYSDKWGLDPFFNLT